jgi:mRNA-degrading endonuclease RelE of RelBE toxin-antitoxin system
VANSFHWGLGGVLWDLAITKPAERDLKALARRDLTRIDLAFEAMRLNPYSGDIKFLKGTSGVLRRRVGPWRVLFEVDQLKRIVIILGVKRRTTTTY